MPMSNGSMLYHPEMNEGPDLGKLFHVQFNHGNSYSLCWLASRDEEARIVLKKHRVRPAFGTQFTEKQTGPGKSSYGMWPGQNVFTCLITDNAEEKLVNAGLVAIEKLLD